MPKLSLGSWAFSFGPFADNPWPFSKVMQYTADAGYDGVELNGFRPHPHPEDFDTPQKCKELIRELSDLGLGVSGYAPDFTQAPPAEVDTEDYLRVVRQCLAFCERCGIDALRVDSVSPPVVMPDDDYKKRFDRLVATWQATAREAAVAGVRIVWEFEPGFWLNKPSEVLWLAQAVDHENFGLLFDTSHAYMGAVVGARYTGEKETLEGGVIEYAEMLADHIGHLHLIDSDGSLHDNDTSTHTPFGKGHIDFPAVLKAMNPVIVDMPWWCVDFCFHANVEEDGRNGVSYLKKLIQEVV
jgi:sugar phosphate isomerase/epimerase